MLLQDREQETGEELEMDIQKQNEFVCWQVELKH